MKGGKTMGFALYYKGYLALSSPAALGINFKSSRMLLWIIQVSFMYLKASVSFGNLINTLDLLI